jgi:hypothetical protein
VLGKRERSKNCRRCRDVVGNRIAPRQLLSGGCSSMQAQYSMQVWREL